VTIRLYFDEDSMWQALVTALRARGIDVQTALEAAMIERTDENHLVCAPVAGRVLCSFNVGDFYRLHIPASSSPVSSSTLSGSICAVCST
jgi:hypothetical protein